MTQTISHEGQQAQGGQPIPASRAHEVGEQDAAFAQPVETLLDTAAVRVSGRDGEPTAPDSTDDTLTDLEPRASTKVSWWKRHTVLRKLQGGFEKYPHLLALKPKERFVFRSDYFEVDESVACVMAFFHDEAAADGFPAFWGINRIPFGLDERVTTIVLEQAQRRDERWVDQYTKASEKMEKLDTGDSGSAGSASSKRKAEKRASDMDIVTAEILNGATYLSVHNRLFVKAPDLETLEDSLDRITRLYIERFKTIKVAPYAGEQRQELSNLWATNDKKRGKGFGFTSTELAGSYSLVTNGLNDPAGEHVGKMIGDVNDSAVLMDVNDYKRRVVIADSAQNEDMGYQQMSNLWCSKLSQSTMLANGRVVHLVLDGADLDQLGPRFDRLTARVDLNAGDVNMFEMFGEVEDELTIFSAQMQKLVLMFEQVYQPTDNDRAVIRGQLEKTLTRFYIDQRMWLANAQHERERLRVVGIPHKQVPKLQLFVSYLDQAHKSLLHTKHDPKQLEAYNVLTTVAKSMLDNNGDLFNNHTVDALDGIRDARRVVYDFSKLMRRGKGIAMAQLVNIVGFAVGRLARGDSVIVHGVEHIDAGVKAYIEQQLEHLTQRGGRVVLSYNDVDKMLADRAFNKFDAADYTVLGYMRDKTVTEYQELLGQKIPEELEKLIKRRDENLSYLRRGVTNVVFSLDLALGINPHRAAQRRKLEQEAERAEREAQMEALLGGELEAGAGTTSALRQNAASLVAQDDSTGRASQRRARARRDLVSPR